MEKNHHGNLLAAYLKLHKINKSDLIEGMEIQRTRFYRLLKNEVIPELDLIKLESLTGFTPEKATIELESLYNKKDAKQDKQNNQNKQDEKVFDEGTEIPKDQKTLLEYSGRVLRSFLDIERHEKSIGTLIHTVNEHEGRLDNLHKMLRKHERYILDIKGHLGIKLIPGDKGQPSAK